MPLETDPTLLQVSVSLLQWLGVPSLAGFLALYAAWIAFPPELVVESVVDKSKEFNSESRIRIKNNGKLAALDIRADANKVCAKVGGATFQNCQIIIGGNIVARLSGGEYAEISISPGFGFGEGMKIAEFSYVLTLKHRAKLFFFHKEFQKQWSVSLRNFKDGFAWHIVPA